MKNISEKTKKMAQLAILTAIIVMMSFTPLGYLQFGALKITFLMIPVTLGSIVLGPLGGLILGTVFGITSLIQCFGLDWFGTTLMGISPVSTFIMCVVSRALMGWLTGIIFNGVAKVDHHASKPIAFAVTGLCGPLLNTIFFMTALILLFGSTEFIMGFRGTMNIFAFVIAFVGLQGLLEIVVTMFVIILLGQVILRIRNRTGKN